MYLEVVQTAKSLLAVGAHEGLLASVLPNMPKHVVIPKRRVGTESTQVAGAERANVGSAPHVPPFRVPVADDWTLD